MAKLFKGLLFIVAMSLVVLFVDSVFGYDNLNTHPQLTEAAIKMRQEQSKKILLPEQMDWIIKGSIEEDNNPRYLNHYYDPSVSKGLDDVDEAFGYVAGMSAKEWAKNQSGSASLTGDYSEGTILQNYKDGNHERAYEGIGHILHLIQDMSVPAHTRNDSHSMGDPYENWAKMNGVIALGNANFVEVDSLDQAFHELARFSHDNFFSEDTVNINDVNKYKKREKYVNGEKVKYLTNSIDGLIYDLAFSRNPDLINPVYEIDNPNIHLDYWNILYPKAVGYSAGVLDHFLKQFEQIDSQVTQKQQLSLWDKAIDILPNESDFKYFVGDVLFSATGRINTRPFTIAVKTARDFTNEFSTSVKNIVRNIEDVFSVSKVDPLSTTANIGEIVGNLNVKEDGLKDQDLYIGPQNVSAQQMQQDVASLKDESAVIKIDEKVDKVAKNDRDLIIHEPYQWPTEIIHEPFQGEAVASQTLQIQPSFIFVAGSNAEESVEDGDSQPSDSEILEVLIDENQGENVIGQDDDLGDESQVDDGSGSDDQVADDPSQGEQPLIEQNQVSDSQDDVVDDQAQDNLEIDLNPDIEFYLTDYDVRKSDFVLNWRDENGLVENWELQYRLAPKFDWQYLDIQDNVASPDEGSLGFTASYDDLTYYFRLHGKDDKNNFTDWHYLQADISSQPVVINEIAWMGTQSSANDEWIELVNKTDQELDISGWSIKSSYSNTNIPLTGKIAPNGFYLLERTNDDPISNIQADQIYTGDLNNPTSSNPYGQILTLSDDKNVQIDQAYAAWAGENNNTSKIRKTSERVSVWVSGMEGKNWKTYIGFGDEAQDGGGSKILGTPKVKNSQADTYYYLSSNFILGKDMIFLGDRGPYVSDNLINIAQSATLNIEPGTVLKFGYLGGLDIYGRLMARGTSDENIVLTSLDDDEYGGDANGDGQTAIINWRKISFNEGSVGEISDTLFRYAGNAWTTDGEVFYISDAKTKISSSVFEGMGKDVLHFENSDVEVSSSEFKNNKSDAIYIHGGKGDISRNVFDDNKGFGVYIGDPSGRIDVSDNSFTNNKAPIRLDSFGDFSIESNQISNNDYNGILVYASGLDRGTVLLSADMPFVIMGFPVIRPGATLEMSPGTVIKFDVTDFHGMTIEGDLRVVGTQERPIVFTSLYDDEYGGDTNNDGAITIPRSKLWAWIDFAGSENSVLENTIIKYGSASRQSMGGSMAGGSAIYVGETSKNFALRNSQVSNNSNGMMVYGDDAVIENSSFSDSDDTGLSVFADDVIVNGATFNNNQKAIQSDPATMANILLSNLIFNENIYDFWPENLIND